MIMIFKMLWHMFKTLYDTFLEWSPIIYAWLSTEIRRIIIILKLSSQLCLLYIVCKSLIHDSCSFCCVYICFQQCRFPACTIKAWKHGTDECHWRSMTPVCIKEGKTETEYEITDWIGLGRQRQMSNTELVPDQIKQTITRILEPLESLYLDKETKSWKYKTDTGKCFMVILYYLSTLTFLWCTPHNMVYIWCMWGVHQK